jgi:hypothetical protein
LKFKLNYFLEVKYHGTELSPPLILVFSMQLNVVAAPIKIKILFQKLDLVSDWSVKID